MRFTSCWCCQGKARTSVNEFCRWVKTSSRLWFEKRNISLFQRRKWLRNRRKVIFELYFTFFKVSNWNLACIVEWFRNIRHDNTRLNFKLEVNLFIYLHRSTVLLSGKIKTDSELFWCFPSVFILVQSSNLCVVLNASRFHSRINNYLKFVAALILLSNTPSLIPKMNLVLSWQCFFFSSSHRVLKIGNNLVRSFYLETYKKGLWIILPNPLMIRLKGKIAFQWYQQFC